MPPKGIPNLKKEFTGFVAYYDDGKVIKERENFQSKKLNRKLATNWAEINKNKLIALELQWKNQVKARIDKVPPKKAEAPYKVLKPSDWFFSQKGYIDMGSRQIVIIARNIGYIKDDIINITSVDEKTGIIKMYSRAV